MGAGVFVSYRKSDDAGWAGRVRDALANHFGDHQVFFDVDSIRGGSRWDEALDAALTACGALVLVIGPRWVDCLKERQASPDTDYHLREITTALDRGIPVYPVRVHGAPMPGMDDLPPALRDRLPAIQWVEVYESLFGASMQRVIDDIAPLVGAPASREATGAGAGADAGAASGRAETTVGPWGTDADFHEIADAVAATASGGLVRIRAGRYLKRVVLDRPVALVAEGRGEALLDCEAIPCLAASANGVVVRGLHIATSAHADAVGVAVTGGDIVLEDVEVRATWVPTSTGIVASGAGTRTVVVGGRVSSVAVGLRFEQGAGGRAERSSVVGATDHAVVITSGADPLLRACSFDADGATVVVTDEGRGTIDGCVLRSSGGPAIEVRTGGAPVVRGHRGVAQAEGLLAKVPDRLAKARTGERPAPTTDDQPGWAVTVADGGAGRFSGADLASLAITTEAQPLVEDCSIGSVTASAGGRGTFARCEIGQVDLASEADPVFRDGCTISPDRGTKVTVRIGPGARGTFEDCEITGRSVRDGSPDPGLLCEGGSPVLRRCTLKNPGEGALTIVGGSVVLEGGEVRSTVGGPAVVVTGGSLAARDGVRVRGGLRVGAAGAVTVAGGEIEADPVSGAVVQVVDGGTLDASSTTIRGAGFASARKVGRWIERGSEKVRGRSTSVIGTTAPLRAASDATARFVDCDFTGMERPDLDQAATSVRFDGCRLDGADHL